MTAFDGVAFGAHAAPRARGDIIATAGTAGLTATPFTPFDPVCGANKAAVVALVRAPGPR